MGDKFAWAARSGGERRRNLLITRLSLANFRSYRHLDLVLPPRMVVLCGDNAQGKTNLLEAAYMLATTRSHRASSDREVLHRPILAEDTPFSRLFGEAARVAGDVTIEIVLRLEGPAAAGWTDADGVPSAGGALRKRIKVNDIARRASSVVGVVKVVMFSAQDLDLVTGSPGRCRRYLDLVNCQADSRYLRCLQRYQKVLLQRNHLLRMIQEHQARPDQLEFWDRELVDNGSYVIEQRRDLVARLDELGRGIHERLGGGERLDIVYAPSVGADRNPAETEECFMQSLHQGLRREIAQGVTLVGPHRDSLEFRVNGADASKYGSRGQQQSVVLSLKLAEAEYLRSRGNDPPVLLLDDVFADLDRTRRQHLLEAIVSYQQVLITATDLDYFDASFLDGATRFRVREGAVEAA